MTVTSLQKGSTMNAKTFIDHLAADLTSAGWAVELTDTEDYGMLIRSFFATRQAWDDNIGGFALLSPYTNRWNFGGVTVYPKFGKMITRKTYSSARILVSVYGQTDRVTAEVAS